MKKNLIMHFLRWDDHHQTMKIANPPSPPFTKGDLGEFQSYFLTNCKGISVLFLVIAMLLMVTIGYVFSYLIPTKQKSVIFPINSTQAFFIAQSGVEYAIRYSSTQDWRTTATLLGLNNPLVNQRNLGNGRFTINYDNTTDTLTSTGEITGSTVRRIVKVSNLSQQFLNVLILDPASPAPCWCFGTRRARFYIKNVGSNIVTLTAFSGTWTQPPPTRMISRIDMGGDQKFNGNYSSGDPITNFNRGGNSQTIDPGQTIEVLVRWNANTDASNIVIRFYTALGDMFTFNLDPEGDGLPICAVGC